MTFNPIIHRFLIMITVSSLAARSAVLAAKPAIFDNVSAILRERYYDKKFREVQLPALIERYRPAAGSPSDLKARRLAAENSSPMFPPRTSACFRKRLPLPRRGTGRQPQPTFGFQAVRIKDEYFTAFVLEGGPAAASDILPWERVVSVDGLPISKSPRLDWAQKDAFLAIDRNPPIHSILCQAEDEITVVLERTRGAQRSVKLRAQPYSALQAARESARLIEIDGRHLGYVHFWFIHSTGVTELLQELFAGEFSKADGLLLDLRGRGGNGVVVPDMLQIVSDWKKPIVALTDRQSRSAKDALAYEFKQRRLALLVGEQTAGAVIPASFAPVGNKTMLMFPSFTLGEYTAKLELKGGVAPDVFVERAGPYSAGHDPIFERGRQELAQLLKVALPAAEGPTQSRPPTNTPSVALPPAGDLPVLSDLIRKMTDALGGEKALRAHSHRTLSGTTEMIGLPMKGDYMQKASAPNRSLVVMHLGDLLVRQGFNGKVAWTDTPMTGRKMLSGPTADMIKQQAQFYGPLDLTAAYKEVTITGFAVFDGKPSVELKLVGHSGTTSFLYVDTGNLPFRRDQGDSRNSGRSGGDENVFAELS